MKQYTAKRIFQAGLSISLQVAYVNLDELEVPDSKIEQTVIKRSEFTSLKSHGTHGVESMLSVIWKHSQSQGSKQQE